MPKFSVDIRYPIIGFECYELEIEASSAEEAEKKAIEFVQTGEVEGVTSSENQPYYNDMQTYCEGFRPCEYDVEAREI